MQLILEPYRLDAQIFRPVTSIIRWIGAVRLTRNCSPRGSRPVFFNKGLRRGESRALPE
jgi:hypothetical protein